MTPSSQSRTKFMVAGAVLMALILGISAAFADPPSTVNVRGQLLDPQGHALSGMREFRVQFYDAATGGTALGLAINGQTEVSLEGLFNITATLPAPVLTAAEVWYEIALSSSATPGPLVSGDTFPNRVKVESVPFAIESAKANHVDVAGVGVGSVTSSEFDALSGVSANIQGQLDAKVNSADVYTKSEVDASQSAQDSALAEKVAKAGDTMTGALTVNNSYVGIGQATAPSPSADKLYNVGGTLSWNGNPAYRFPCTTVATDIQMAGNNGYIAASGSLLTLTLPASAWLKAGDTLRVSGEGAGGWKIAQGGDQTILTGSMQIPDYSGAWTPRESSRSWRAVASSADGTKMAACVWLGPIYISTDSGVTWTARETDRTWRGLASSADGSKWVATVYSGQIYTSTDSGTTWTPRETTRNWFGAASSSDGAKLAAVVSGGQIYTSSDSGVTWTARDSSRNWYSVASSADGTKLVATVYGGQIYTSSDSGATWTARALNRNWYSVASSADGSRLIASAYGGQLYTSTDSGVTWTGRDSMRGWRGVASSADGTKLVACVDAGQVYTSADSGVTWTARDSSRQWMALAASADGSKLIGCANSSQLCTLNTNGAIVAQTPVGTAGYLAGSADSAVELQYEGRDTFRVLSHETPQPYLTPTKPELDALLAARDASFYTKAEVDSRDASKVAKAGDTMTGALTVNSSYVGIGQALAPSPVTDRLYNVGGTLSWNGSPAYRYPWTAVTGDTQMAGNNGYIVNTTGGATLTLPLSSNLSVGDTVRVVITRDGTWRIAQNASQAIQLGPLRMRAWTARDSVRYWTDVASSSDGVKLVACVNNPTSPASGRLYTSTNSGTSWTQRAIAGYWTGVASSVDGNTLLACGESSALYVSVDSGVTWSPCGGTMNWAGVAMSVDGTRMVACANTGESEYIYTSPDSGATWYRQTGSGARNWLAVASSANGARLVACTAGTSLGGNTGEIYTSINAGVTWTVRPGAGSRVWSDVTMSSDGTKIVATELNGLVYISTDVGATWTPQAFTQAWKAVACSANDTIAACVWGGPVYISTDFGATWAPNGPNVAWDAVAMSDAADLIVGGTQNGYLYVGSGSAASTTAGTAGYIGGCENTTLELLYIGSNTFFPLDFRGTLGGY